ncbi:MAG: hypothetical protein EXX96DRAFT_484665 [Benjaminiella poitrasii]|nr:MAG: hypothetical protein EXX96DRAFT_484665 [Benjaminiella poitrasii]
MYERITWKRATTNDVAYCKDVTDREEAIFGPANEMSKIIKACCKHFINANYYIQINSEESFLKKYFNSFKNSLKKSSLRYVLFKYRHHFYLSELFLE